MDKQVTRLEENRQNLSTNFFRVTGVSMQDSERISSDKKICYNI